MAMRLVSTPSTQTGISGRSIFFLLVFMCFSGTLILTLLSGESKAPQLISPESHVLLRGYEGQDIPLTIKWRQGGITEDRLFPSRATRFVVCFFEHGLNNDCSGDGTDVLLASEEATAIPRTKLGSPGLVYSLIDRLYPFYEYTYDIELPASVLNTPLQWTVGACSGGTQLETCSFARPDHHLGISNRNLVAERIDDSPTPTKITFMVELKNEGDTTNEPYQAVFKVWEILSDSSQRQPLTNVTNDAADNAQTVITQDGEEAPIAEFRNGSRSDLFAIQSPGTPSIVWFVDYPAVPSPNASRPTSVRPCDLPYAADCEIMRQSGSTALFAAFYKIDPNNTLLEFNEGDNVKMLRTIR